MKGSLILPIQSRRSSSFVTVPTISVDEPVESPAQLLVIDSPKEKDRDIDREINRAMANAEANRRMSLESESSPEGRGTPKIRRNRHDNLSVKFGNESDMEYVEDDDSREFSKTVRRSKEFDGNRSGRKSAKQ